MSAGDQDSGVSRAKGDTVAAMVHGRGNGQGNDGSDMMGPDSSNKEEKMDLCESSEAQDPRPPPRGGQAAGQPDSAIDMTSAATRSTDGPHAASMEDSEATSGYATAQSGESRMERGTMHRDVSVASGLSVDMEQPPTPAPQSSSSGRVVSRGDASYSLGNLSVGGHYAADPSQDLMHGLRGPPGGQTSQAPDAPPGTAMQTDASASGGVHSSYQPQSSGPGGNIQFAYMSSSGGGGGYHDAGYRHVPLPHGLRGDAAAAETPLKTVGEHPPQLPQAPAQAPAPAPAPAPAGAPYHAPFRPAPVPNYVSPHAAQIQHMIEVLIRAGYAVYEEPQSPPPPTGLQVNYSSDPSRGYQSGAASQPGGHVSYDRWMYPRLRAPRIPIVGLQKLPELRLRRPDGMEMNADKNVGLSRNGEIIVAEDDKLYKYRLDVNADPCFRQVWCVQPSPIIASARKQVYDDGRLLFQPSRDDVTTLWSADMQIREALWKGEDARGELSGCLYPDYHAFKIKISEGRRSLKVMQQGQQAYELRLPDHLERYKWRGNLSFCESEEQDMIAVLGGYYHTLDMFVRSTKDYIQRVRLPYEGITENAVCCNHSHVFVVGSYPCRVFVYSWTGPGKQMLTLRDLGIDNQDSRIHGIHYCLEQDVLLMAVGTYDNAHYLHAYKISKLTDDEAQAELDRMVPEFSQMSVNEPYTWSFGDIDPHADEESSGGGMDVQSQHFFSNQ